jgi:hypothetical protein
MIAQILLRTGIAVLVGIAATLALMGLVLLAQTIEQLTGITGWIWLLIGLTTTALVWLYDALT